MVNIKYINRKRKEKSTQFQEYFLEVGSLTKGSHNPEVTDKAEADRDYLATSRTYQIY